MSLTWPWCKANVLTAIQPWSLFKNGKVFFELLHQSLLEHCLWIHGSMIYDPTRAWAVPTHQPVLSWQFHSWSHKPYWVCGVVLTLPSPVAIFEVLKYQTPILFLLKPVTVNIINHVLQVLHQPHPSQLMLSAVMILVVMLWVVVFKAWFW